MEADNEYPAVRRLAELGEAGWSFVHHQKEDGSQEVVQIDAYWAWPSGPVDCVRVRAAGDAMALRSDGQDPPVIMWEMSGGVDEVILAIRDLPPPTSRLAPGTRSERAPFHPFNPTDRGGPNAVV